MFKLIVLLTFVAMASAQIIMMHDAIDAEMSKLRSKYNLPASIASGKTATLPKGGNQIDLESASYGRLVLCRNCKAIVDSTTSIIAAPKEAVDLFHAQLGLKSNAKGQYIVDCGKITPLPSYSFIIGGQNITLGPWQYMIQTNGECMSSVTYMGSDYWILSKVFVRQSRKDFVSSLIPNWVRTASYNLGSLIDP